MFLHCQLKHEVRERVLHALDHELAKAFHSNSSAPSCLKHWRSVLGVSAAKELRQALGTCAFLNGLVAVLASTGKLYQVGHELTTEVIFSQERLVFFLMLAGHA